MTTVVIRIPTPPRGYTRGADEVRVEGSIVSDALANLGRLHTGVLDREVDAQGKQRPFVNVLVGANDARTLAGLATALTDRAVLSIVPAVAGGIAT